MTQKVTSLGDLIPKYLGKDAQPRHAIALMGGGLDGFLAAHSLLQEYPSIEKLTLLFFDYGQSSVDIERKMVHKQMEYFGRPAPQMIHVGFYEVKDGLTSLLRDKENPLTSPTIISLRNDAELALPEAAHDPQNRMEIEGIQIYVPNRNARFVTQAFGIAELLKADVVTLGAVGNVNMDNSLAFIDAACAMHKVSGERPVAIYAPFVLMSKSFVAHYANTWGLNAFNGRNENVLRDVTVSCFFPMKDSKEQGKQATTMHCGQCRSCQTLKQGFRFANVFDPYSYSNY